jgi:hypothetical protein
MRDLPYTVQETGYIMCVMVMFLHSQEFLVREKIISVTWAFINPFNRPGIFPILGLFEYKTI